MAKILPTGRKGPLSGIHKLKKDNARNMSDSTEALAGVSESQLQKHPITAFQRRVYALTQEIPKGYVTTYGAMAQMLNSSPRAVGQALKRNPFAPTVPWYAFPSCPLEPIAICFKMRM